MNFSRHKSGRRAFTLVETVYMVLAECAVVTLGIGALFLVTEVRYKERRDDAARETASKLAEQFRGDLRTAELAELAGDRLRLVSPDGEIIEYVIHANELPKKSRIERTQSRDGRRLRREIFFLPFHASAWFERGKGEHAGFCALSVWISPTDRRDRILVTMPEKERLDPFSRECSGASGDIDFDPCHAANWRTICGKVKTSQLPSE